MPLSSGEVINNRYRIVRLLGQGGFGAVYRAWDLNLSRPCALKENLSTSGAAESQFRREASLLANLNHPNLPRVTDHFSLPGEGQYLVMDYIEGQDLQTLLEQSKELLPLSQVLHWVAQVCDALAYLHSQNPPIIHRDIKPKNIIINPAGQALLVDFGIAKVYDPHKQTTQGARAVTPGFSPQEQYGYGKTDERADVYALGATLYNLLTGQAPVESVVRNFTPLPSPSQFNPQIPENVESAILKALAIAPADRFPNASEFKQALESKATLQVARTTVAATVLAPAPGPKVFAPVQGRWLAVAIVAALALFTGAGGFLFARLLAKGTPVPSSGPVLPAIPAVLEATSTPIAETMLPPNRGQQATPSPSPTLSPTVTATPIAGSSWEQGKVAYVSKQGGHNQIYIREPIQNQTPRVLLEPEWAIRSEGPAWSPDGTRIAFFSWRQSFSPSTLVISAEPGSRPELIGEGGHSPAWSPDGKQVLFPRGNVLFIIVDALYKDEKNRLDPDLQTAQLPAWSPDGAQIAFAAKIGDNTAIFSMPASGGTPLNLTNYPGENYAPAWSPDGKWIAFQSDRDQGGHRSEIWIMDSAGSQLRQITNTPGEAWARAPAWSPDSQWIAFVSNHEQSIGADYGELYVISLWTGEIHRLTDTGGNVYDWRPTWAR